MFGISANKIDWSDLGAEIEGLDDIPDGAITVKRASNANLDYRLQINDYKYLQYHRNNGITKIGTKQSGSNSTQYLLRQAEGAMLLSDLMNGAYIRSIFNETYINSGQIFMPFSIQMDKEFSRLTNFLGVMVFPICLSFAMPIFLYNLVLEKELRLLENMKINGLKI